MASYITPAQRSQIATLVALIKKGGFVAEKTVRRVRHPGFSVRYAGRKVPRPGLFVAGDSYKNGEFAQICAHLIAEGCELTDCRGGPNFVSWGVAGVRLPRT